MPADADDKTSIKKQKTQADQIRDLTLGASAATIWDGEHAYVVITEAGYVRCLAVGSRAFRRWVVKKLRSRKLGVPKNDAFKAAELGIEAEAEGDGIEPAPSIRVAGQGSEIWIDLGRDDWKCVHVTKAGWEVVPHPADGPYMYRPPRMAALPLPKRGGDIERLWRHLNVKGEADRLLLIATIVQQLWPRGPYVVLVLFGEHGSAKTTGEEMIKSLTDPTRPDPNKQAPTSLRRPPNEERDVAAAANGARVIGYENVSYLPDFLADAICALATGADLGGRALYTDFDEAIVSATKPVMINGIPDVVGRGDLAERSVKIEMHPPKRRRGDAQVWSAFKRDQPQLFGALLDVHRSRAGLRRRIRRALPAAPGRDPEHEDQLREEQVVLSRGLWRKL